MAPQLNNSAAAAALMGTNKLTSESGQVQAAHAALQVGDGEFFERWQAAEPILLKLLF
jgi:hypothetical protein